ncbi:SasC/FmtB family protein [Staphylococcus haemolyticus]|uniref:SasC/FmtB family protein n=1 Tax=Staphylococcus haemolyticus TaxID=1283 RepID=UPI00069FCCA1|nr:SasC/FmtB family protein [Staphylococcus haemolyticus]
MNLFKKQKFSIRKFTVGTFSTVIATLAFITHTGHAAELDEHSQSAQQKITESKNTEDLNQHQSDAIKDSSKSESKINANPTLNKEAVSETIEVPNKTQTTNSTENKNSTEISDKDIDQSKVKGNNVDTNQPILDNNESNKNSKAASTHKRVKRDANDATSNTQTQQDPMAINETNSGQIINGNFTDTSNGAEIPTAATESAMDEASKIPGWKVVNSQQTQIPLVWGPKVLPSYTYITFDKTNNKIGAVLSKYSDNLSYGRPDNSVGPIYQDIDVTPGSELQFHYIGSSIGNISGFNSARMFIYDANNPSTLLYKGTPKTSSQPFGIFKGVFNVPENISRIRLQFESLVNVSHDTYNGHRLLKGPNNFGGGVVADVSVNTGAYLKVSAAQTDYQANSTSDSSPDVNAKLNVSIENKGHSSSNKTQYKVVLPEGVTFVSAENATGTFNEDTRELTLNINPIAAGTTRDISYTVSLPTTVPIKKDFSANLIYQTEGINMNRQNGSRDLAVQTPGDNNYLRYGGNNEFIITESDQRQGSTIAPTQSVTVNMYKDAINSKISEIEAELAQVNQNDYSTEAWNNLQTALTNAKVVKNETDATPLTDRKNQAEINKLLLNLEKAKAKFDIDKAAKARESVINSNTEATTEEKQAALTKLQNKFNENKAEIDKLTISNDIAPLKESSISQINSINVTATKKAEAKQAIEAALTQRKVFIDGHYDATQEEKEVAMNKATEEANKAKALIDQATSNNDVDQAQTNGIDIINTIDAVVIKKANGKKAIEQAAEAKKALINQMSDATQEEKDAAIQRVTDEVRKADRLIDMSTTNNGVDEFQARGISAINNIQPEIVKKSDAKQSIDIAVLNQKALVNNNNEATQEEKDVALAKIDEAAKQAKAAIDAATTNNAVDEATTNNTTIISGILPETVKKAAARKAIDDAATAKKEAINNTPDATQEEKDAAIAKVDAAVSAAKQAITQATTNDSVDQEQTNGNNTIASIQPEVTKKAAARKAIDDEVVAKKAAIDNVADATDEEKQAAKDKVDAEATKAKAAIDQANTNSDVEQAKSSGVSTIEAIQPETIKKSSAKQAIDDSANAKKAAIDNNSDATQEEKDAAKAKVDAEVTKAKAAIDQATTNDGVDQAKDLGNNAISIIQPDVVKKAAARKAIDDAATAKKQEIDQHPSATQDEKDAAKAKVDAEVQKAKAAINQANSNNDVDQVQNSETATIAGIQVDAVKKANAKQAIDDAATAKKQEIDQHPTATKEEKDAAKAKVDEEVDKAKKAIDASTTNDTVDQAKDSGITTINNIQPESIEKIKAKKAIDDTVTAKKNVIDQDNTTTQEEKEAAKTKVDEEATKAKQLIEQASTNDAVHETRDNEITAINKIQPEAIKKAEAKQAIDDAATAKKATIDQVSNATQEEKDAAKAKVDEEVTKAKSAIDNAVTNNDVDQVKTNKTTIISSIEPEAIKKATAKQAIDVAVAAKKQEIDNNENATQEEKEAAKAKVDEEATKAKAAIDHASTNSDVEQAKTTGETTISSIQPEVVKKAEAKQAIDDAVTAKKAEIDQNQEATKEEKEAAKAKVDEEATKAKATISQASTNNDVDQAKTSSVTTISSIQPDIVKKAEAKKAIEDEVIAKKAEIDQNQEATKEEKDAAKAKVDEEATKAKQAIDNATTNESVNQAKTQGVTTITSIQPETNKKAEAKHDIDEVAKAKKQEIDSNINATKEEKDVAKSKVDEEVTKAKNVIDQATTNDQVDQGNNNGHTAITAIQHETVKKPEAKQAIDEVAKAKKDLIDQTPNATKEEKDAAKAKVDEEVTKAKKAIDQASTNSDVDQVKDKGTNGINSVVVEVLKKDEAKKAIDDLVKAKKSAIDSNHNATKEEKEAAKAKVDDEAKKAKDIIDQGTTNSEVDQTKNSSSNIIKNIQPETIKKSVAKQTLLDQAKAKKAEIDNNNNATKEEKDAAKAEVDKIIDKANKAIDNANTNDDVDKVHVTFTTKLKEVKVKIVKKPEAQKIILEVANKQKDKIDQLVGLTDEQRNKAKYLIDEIVRKALDKLNKDITNKDVDSILNKAVEDIKKVNPTVSKGEQVLPRDSNDGIDRNNNNKLGNNSNTNPSSNNKSNKLPSTGEESQRQSPLAGFALISGLFLFLKNRKRNKENN